LRKTLAQFASAVPEPDQIWEFLNRDFIGDFETKLEIQWHLGGQSFEMFLRWKSVISRIYA
jgi:hypothetical protein